MICGQRLGTGAYMSKLTRTRAGIFDIKDALTLTELEDIKEISKRTLCRSIIRCATGRH
jgi:tRNA U55 pseudouridine synthase TruB